MGHLRALINKLLKSTPWGQNLAQNPLHTVLDVLSGYKFDCQMGDDQSNASLLPLYSSLNVTLVGI